MVSWILLLKELTSDVGKISEFTVWVCNPIFFIFPYLFVCLSMGVLFVAVVWWKIRLPSYIFTVLGKTRAKYLLSWNGPLGGETRRNGPGSNIIPPGMLFVWGGPTYVPGETTAEWNLPAVWKGVQRRGDNVLLQVRMRVCCQQCSHLR